MSDALHEPDLARTPCPGCGELVSDATPERDEELDGRSCCRWLPYHARCTIDVVGAPSRADRCAACNAVIPFHELLPALETLAARLAAPHEPPGAATKLRWRRLRGPAQRMVELSTSLHHRLAGAPEQLTAWSWKLLMRFVPVHRECPPAPEA